MPELVLGQSIETVRIPELPLFSSYGPLTTSDYFVLWLAAFNKTVKIDAQSMYVFMQGGDGGVTTPVVIGDKHVHVVTEAEAGGQIVNIPSLAGKNFFLEREGYPLLTTEYDILNSGGFQLKNAGDLLVKDHRYVLHLYSLQAGTTGGTGGTATPLINGAVSVSNNTTFDTVNHVNKLIQIRGNGTKITFTLPLIADIPVNTIIPIEAQINNTVEQRITTQGGQLIYLNNVSKTSIYLRTGEVVWLYRGTDGYYVINDFARIYRELARPFASYEIGLNELLCKGQVLNRADYPRLWEKIQSLGFSLVSDADWNLAQVYRQGNAYSTTPPAGEYETIERPYRGCFSTGDANTTFRLPDLMNMFLRGIKSDTGSDNERYQNKAGFFQNNINKSHSHDVGTSGENVNSEPGKTLERNNVAIDQYIPGGDVAGPFIKASGGAESRPDNVGVLWVIKY